MLPVAGRQYGGEFSKKPQNTGKKSQNKKKQSHDGNHGNIARTIFHIFGKLIRLYEGDWAINE